MGSRSRSVRIFVSEERPEHGHDATSRQAAYLAANHVTELLFKKPHTVKIALALGRNALVANTAAPRGMAPNFRNSFENVRELLHTTANSKHMQLDPMTAQIVNEDPDLIDLKLRQDRIPNGVEYLEAKQRLQRAIGVHTLTLAADHAIELQSMRVNRNGSADARPPQAAEPLPVPAEN